MELARIVGALDIYQKSPAILGGISLDVCDSNANIAHFLGVRSRQDFDWGRSRLVAKVLDERFVFLDSPNDKVVTCLKVESKVRAECGTAKSFRDWCSGR